MARVPLTSSSRILTWIEENICKNCAFYRTNQCDPKIEKNWMDAESSIDLNIYYSVKCFKFEVRNELKEFEETLRLDKIENELNSKENIKC